MKRKRLTQVFPFLLPINVLCPSNVPPKISPKTANLLMSEGHT